MSLFIAAILSVFGFTLLAWLLSSILSPLKSLVSGYRDQSEFRRANRQLKLAGELMDKTEYDKAILHLERSLILGIQRMPESISKVREHHQNILSRCLIVGEEMDLDTAEISTEISEVESFLLQKSELELLAYRARDSYQRFLSKQNKAGKPTPRWSKEEYQDKINEIAKNLDENKKELNRAISSLFTKLKTPQNKDSVVYH